MHQEDVRRRVRRCAVMDELCGPVGKVSTLSVKQYMAINKIIDECDAEIKRRGSCARVTLKMPGKMGKHQKRRYSRTGPKGTILAETNDHRKILVQFEAHYLKSSLKGVKNDRATSRLGN